MAATINAGEGTRRSDMWFVDPFSVIMQEELRGRHRPPEEAKIIATAISLKEHGQRQPVEARKLPDKRLQLTLGFTRTAAARLLVSGFDHEGQHYEDKEFKLKVLAVDCNDKLAFVHNVVENAHRHDTNPIDDAYNQRRLREDYGYSDAEIARLYQYHDATKVARLKRLLLLDDAMQQQVETGVLSVTAALDLLELPPEQQKKALEVATKKEGGRVDGSAISRHVREHILRDANPSDVLNGENGTNGTNGQKPKVRYKPRTVGDVKRFMEELAAEDCPPVVKEFVATFRLFLKGQRSEPYMKDFLVSHLKK